MKLSIIIPVFNEIKCIKAFTDRLFTCFQKEEPQYIFIDDGSEDGTTKIFKKCNKTRETNLSLFYMYNYYVLYFTFFKICKTS